MGTCGKKAKITAELKEDGDTIAVSIASDCENVRGYAGLLGSEIHVSDVTEWENSRLVNPEIRMPLSMPCLVPNAIMDAAWMELGMLSKNRAGQAGRNDIEFERERGADSPPPQIGFSGNPYCHDCFQN